MIDASNRTGKAPVVTVFKSRRRKPSGGNGMMQSPQQVGQKWLSWIYFFSPILSLYVLVLFLFPLLTFSSFQQMRHQQPLNMSPGGMPQTIAINPTINNNYYGDFTLLSVSLPSPSTPAGSSTLTT